MSVLEYLFVGTVVLALWYLVAVIVYLLLYLLFNTDDFSIGLLMAPMFLILIGVLGKLVITIF